LVQLFFFVAVGLGEIGESHFEEMQLVFVLAFLEVLGNYFVKVEPVFA
jgi:hypothetical protein